VVEPTNGTRLGRDVVSWSSFELSRPELAELGLTMLTKHGFCYLGTVSRHGHPRITPVSVVRVNRGLYLSLVPSTPKCRDLLNAPTFYLHALPGPGRAEFAVRGAAQLVADTDRPRIVAGHHAAEVIIDERDQVFELLVGTAIKVVHHQVDGCLTSEVDRWQPAISQIREGGDNT
jgi:hypothetical protein